MECEGWTEVLGVEWSAMGWIEVRGVSHLYVSVKRLLLSSVCYCQMNQMFVTARCLLLSCVCYCQLLLVCAYYCYVYVTVNYVKCMLLSYI